MSDDLISRREALKRLQLLRKINPAGPIQIIIDAAEQQIKFCQAAFDKDKVMQELQEDADLSVKNGLWYVELDRIFEIIEKGGIDG